MQEAIRRSAAVVGGAPTVVVTFTDARTLPFAENWALHLQKARVPGVVVGLVGMRKGSGGSAAFGAFTFSHVQQRFGRLGAAVYATTSRTHAQSPQGGRWFSVVPLIGLRVLLSDSDVVWLRDPLPYLVELEQAHPRMDFAVSTDAQGMSDARRLGSFESSSSSSSRDLDVESYRLCRESMNIGIIAFAPGARPGAKRAVAEAVAHMSLPHALRSVDQGQINHRWKRGAGGWHWPRQMHPVADASGARLCGLVNGSSIAGVLPIAQFGNTLTHGLLKLSTKVVADKGAAAALKPFAVHATWMRTQLADYKIPSALLTAKATLPRAKDGATMLPAEHLRLMWVQLAQLRNALFVARLLGRALILPEIMCGCELGFHPRHVGKGCRAHQSVELPHPCPFDHFLNPTELRGSPYQIRDRAFLSDPRTPMAVRRESVVKVEICGNGSAMGRTGNCGRGGGAVSGVVQLVHKPFSDTIVKRLRDDDAMRRVRRLHFEDMRLAFGGFAAEADGTPPRTRAVQWYKEAQALLSSWCCTSDQRFKPYLDGLVPYLFPPPRHARWRPELAAAVKATSAFMA